MSQEECKIPLLEDLIIGEPISDQHGVRCCPAVNQQTGGKYIIKIISFPASSVQLDALLLTGAYADSSEALAYFRGLAKDTLLEAQQLQQLAQIDGFMGFEDCQIVEKEDGTGFELYLLSQYRQTLERYLARNPMTYLGAVNLAMDLCAALAVCRQSGYLYAALKPDNIYQMDRGFQIGDLGLIRLDALSYTSMPEKYRSAYTAPEITDAYSALNSTIDIYAAGLIVYQAYNNGQLPTYEDGVLLPPAYADYEMAEILLKACHADPQQRWQTPEEMGQAIAQYLQRNTVTDDLIVPPPVLEPLDEPVETEQLPVDAESEDESFQEEQDNDETAPSEELAAELEDTSVTEEVNEMLLQADDLIAHEVPEPVVAPEPVEIVVPPLVIPQEEPETQAIDPEEPAEEEISAEEPIPDAPEDEPTGEPEQSVAAQEPATEETPQPEEVPVSDTKVPAKKRKSGKKVAVTVAILTTLLVLLLVAAGGFYYYENFYIQTVRAITLSGQEDYLTVKLDTDIDNSLLTVVCTDTYGNTKRLPVENNEAHFTALNPDSQYKVTVEISGFHKLVGNITDSHTTGPRTNITAFSAINGSESGSVILTFTSEGQDTDAWRVVYQTAGEEQRSLEFTGNKVTLTGLTVGREYTFELVPVPEQYIIGTPIIRYTPSALVFAQDLSFLGFEAGALQVRWNCPEDVTVKRWTVRCHSDSGYDETITVQGTSASFPGLDPDNAYTVDVTADQMTVGTQAYLSAGSVTIKPLQLDNSTYGQLNVRWEFEGSTPAEGWLLLYSINGGEAHVIRCDDSFGTISPLIPGASYAITVQPSGGSTVFGGTGSFTAPGGDPFNAYGINAANFKFRMCWTPSNPKWKWYDLWEKDFTTVFKPGERAAFIFNCNGNPVKDNAIQLYVMFVIKDSAGNVYSINSITKDWGTMWYQNYAELEIPALPSTPGSYTIDIYFNDGFVTTQPFSIT